MKYLKPVVRPLAVILVLGMFVMTRAMQEVFADDVDRVATVVPEVLVKGQNSKKKSYNPGSLSSAKYTQPLRDIPQTVGIVSQAVMQDQGATTLRETLRNVPGISMQAGEGGTPAGDQLSIRGFSARTDIFVDGIRDFGGYTRDPFAFEQVEVVKGPASSYSGRGSTGGSINQVTKHPELNPFYRGSIGFGSAYYKRTTLDLNQPVPQSPIEGTALRLNAMWNKSNAPGRDEVKNHRWGVAPSLVFGLGTPTRLNVDYFYLGQENLPDYGIPWVPNTNNALREFRDYPAPADWHNFYGLVDRDFESTGVHIVTGKMEHDFGDSVTLRDTLRWGQASRDSIITPPRFNDNNSTVIRRSDWKSRDQVDTILDNQTELSLRFETFGLEHEAIAGFEYIHEKDTNATRLKIGPDSPGTSLFEPNPDDPYLEMITPNGQVAEGTGKTAAFYGFDTLHLNKYFDITGGARWDYFQLDFTPAAGDDLGRIDRPFSWNAGLVFKPLPYGSVYFGYGTAVNPSAEGLALSSAANAANNIATDPERTRTYEVGTKWDFFNERLSLNTALFRTLKFNARTTDPGTNAASTVDDVVILEGEQRVHGWEAGISGNMTQDWKVFSAYTLLDSEITESRTVSEVGHELPNTPGHTFNFWSTWRLPGKLDKFEIGAGAQYVDRRFNSNANTRKAPEYWIFNSMASYQLTREVTLRMNFYNMADQEYLDQIGGGHVIPGAGRMVTVSTDFEF